jgi:hypothetical protein
VSLAVVHQAVGGLKSGWDSVRHLNFFLMKSVRTIIAPFLVKRILFKSDRLRYTSPTQDVKPGDEGRFGEEEPDHDVGPAQDKVVGAIFN